MSATFNFRSLSDPIDTASSGGRLVMHIMGALAEFERGLIVERNAGGLWPLARALIECGEISPCGCAHDACRQVHALSCPEGH